MARPGTVWPSSSSGILASRIFSPIDWPDLFQFDAPLAEDVIDFPETMCKAAAEAIRDYDLPVETNFENLDVRFRELPDNVERDIGHLGKGDEDQFRRVTGQVTKNPRSGSRSRRLPSSATAAAP
ncbi:MAG: hypothetical protein U5J98_07070 [Halobacteriales archaeon]|nr:hypothetical protein [Halobacteriales archaeon]